jgi:peptidoglycan hydrolase CwlO-like protein
VARLLLGKSAKLRGRGMNRSLIVAISLICVAPLHAQNQPNTAKLKADAQKIVSIISGDKAKAQAYCQILDLGEQIGEADQKKDDNKAEVLSQKLNELLKQLGPEYLAFVESAQDLDPNSKRRSRYRDDVR